MRKKFSCIYFGGKAADDSLRLCPEPGDPEPKRPGINDDGDGWGKCDGDGDPGTVSDPLGGATPLNEVADDELDTGGNVTEPGPTGGVPERPVGVLKPGGG